jgi:glycosyltransferase involved in cell wall biosynthesis
MKILFICENYLPHYGGAEVVFKNLAERYQKCGHQSTILTHQLKNTKKTEIINNVQVHRIPSLFSRYIFSFTAIPKAIKLAQQHDIIQTTTFNGAFPAWIAGKLTRKPVVITIHEIWIGKWQDITGFSYFKSKIHSFLERMIYSLPFNYYICVSDATKNDLLKQRGNNKNLTQNIQTVYNGLDYNFWNPALITENEIKKIREKHQLDNHFTCFSWGRPGESKGFEYLIEALPEVIKTIPNSKLLLLFGSKEQYQKKYRELLNLIEKLNLNKHIELLPKLSQEELRAYIKAVDCIIVPSKAEGFGYTTVETSAIGTPIVISNAGSLPEVVSGKYQIFQSKNAADLAKKIIKINNKEYLETKPKRFEWNESIEKYLKVYQELIK